MKKIMNNCVQKIMLFFKTNIVTISLTCVIWILMNLTSYQSFYFTVNSGLTYSLCKFCHFFFLLFIVYNLIRIIKKTIEKNRNELFLFLILFIILFAVLLFIWPGAWSWDDILVLTNSASYDLTPWQNFMSGFFDIMCLKTIPFSAGVIIMQIIIASLISSYCIDNITSVCFKKNKYFFIKQLLLIIPFLFSPILMYILAGFRMGIYSYLELLLIVKLLLLYFNKSKCSIINFFVITFLTIVIATWRTEAIYYPLLVFIYLIIIGRKKINIKFSLLFLVISLVGILFLNNINNKLLGNNNYNLIPTLNPITDIIKNIDITSENESIESVDKVIDVNKIIANPNMNGETYYFSGNIVRNDYTDEEYKEYLLSYLKLSFKYNQLFMKSTFIMFHKSIGAAVDNYIPVERTMTYNSASNTTDLMDTNTESGNWWTYTDLTFQKSINSNLRINLINMISGVDNNGRATIIYYSLWNLYIPLFGLLIILIILLIKKCWALIFLLLTVLCRVPLLIVTSPAPYFMYYLSVYLISYFLIIFAIIYFISKKHGTVNDIN